MVEGANVEGEMIETLRKGGPAAKGKNQAQAAEEDSAGENNYSDADVEAMSQQEEDMEEDEFEHEYRERRKAYDKLEDIKHPKPPCCSLPGSVCLCLNGLRQKQQFTLMTLLQRP